MAIFNFTPWRQKTPSQLKPNCLLTRYPVLFFAESLTWLDRFDPWNGIPRFLKDHGYDVKSISNLSHFSRLGSSKVHLIAKGNAAVEVLHAVLEATESPFVSLTFVDPIFDFSDSEIPVLQSFSIPAELLFGILNSRETGGPEYWASQRIAKTWGPVFNFYDGDSKQLQGRGPRPSDTPSAHEFFLEHCIFLAEYDLTASK